MKLIATFFYKGSFRRVEMSSLQTRQRGNGTRYLFGFDVSDGTNLGFKQFIVDKISDLQINQVDEEKSIAAKLREIADEIEGIVG